MQAGGVVKVATGIGLTTTCLTADVVQAAAAVIAVSVTK